MDTVCRLYTSGNVTSTSLENRGRKKKKKTRDRKKKGTIGEDLSLRVETRRSLMISVSCPDLQVTYYTVSLARYVLAVIVRSEKFD